MFHKTLKSSHCALAIFIFGLVLSASALPAPRLLNGIHQRRIRSMGRFCGQNLTDALRLVCYSKYYTPPPKRSNTFDSPVIGAPFHSFDEQDSELTENKEKKGAEYTSSNTDEVDQSYLYRQIRGVHDECCKKPCTIKQMKQYCMENKRTSYNDVLIDYSV